ncbi:unnamed protein product [Parajaminaea phylloscopi]
MLSLVLSRAVRDDAASGRLLQSSPQGVREAAGPPARHLEVCDAWVPCLDQTLKGNSIIPAVRRPRTSHQAVSRLTAVHSGRYHRV